MPRAESGSVGTPISVARGRGRRAPLVQTEAEVVAGVTRSSVRPDPVREVDGLRAQGQHRLGTDVDEVPGDRLEAQLAAQPVAALEHRHPGRREGVEHLERGGEAGDAAPHDDDAGPGGHGRDRHATQPLTHGRNPRRAPAPDSRAGPGVRRRAPLVVRVGQTGGRVRRGRGRDRRRSSGCSSGPAGAGSFRPPGTGTPATPLTACVEYEYASTASAMASMLTSSAFEVDVVDGVARLVVALVERLTRDATPDGLPAPRS